jgi:hypothetical protein
MKRTARALALAFVLAAGCERSGVGAERLAELPPPAEPDAPESWQPYYEAISALGDGFVVWESFRKGHWRIWLRPLDGGPERQLSPDEPGRDHVAAHIAPDGRHLVYLSLPAPHDSFKRLPAEVVAPLRLVRLENGRAAEDRVLVANARTYNQSRAAVWVNSAELIYLAADSTTRQLDVTTGEERVLVPSPVSKWGMLVNATHTHATNGQPTFSVFHPDDGTIARRRKLPGCQPYFTPDGRFGYWMAGTGGPVRTYDLADGSTRLVIDRNSKFLPEGRGYLYYPMASPDLRLLALSTSRNKHGHFDADFDVYVAPIDPDTLEVTGTAVRYSFSPGQDRFPDVFVAGYELGRLRGEAPFRARFRPDPGGPEGGWSFDFGDGTPASSEGSHVFEKAGSYRVTARRGGRVLGGEVRVAAGAPPSVLRTEVRSGGRELAVVFDERVDSRGAKVRLESGAQVAGVAAGERASTLVVTLVESLRAPDVLVVEGISDRAAVPHVLTPQRLPVEPQGWPGRAEGLVFVFATEDDERSAKDVDSGHERSFGVVAHGRARLDAHGALRVGRGWFEAEELPKRFAEVIRDADALTLEVTVWPAERSTEEARRIVSFAADEKSQNLSLSQEGDRALLRIRTTVDGEKHHAEEKFAHLEVGRPNHLIVSYRPGRLVAYQDGRQIFETDALTGTLEDWRDGLRLAFGADPGGARDFSGTIEGISIYARFLEAEEAAAHANAYLSAVEERESVPRTVVNARLVGSSPPPTPEQIVPYREALVLNEYEVLGKRRKKLGSDRVRVAHWAVLDAHSQSVPEAANGGRVRLALEPWESHPRLESAYLSDTLEPDPEIPLYVDVSD